MLNLKLISLIFILAVFINSIIIYELIHLDSTSYFNKFELGFWAIPIFSSDLFLLGVGILYHKQRLPQILNKFIIFIFKFEISKKIALITIIIILSFYVVLNLNGLQQQETFIDTPLGLEAAKNWQLQLSQWVIGANLKYFFLHYSFYIFHNFRIIPFLASMSIAILTYLITADISKKRFAGIIAMVSLLQSPLFFKYASTATYENFWILFYILSLYLIHRWYLSSFAYVLSLMSKGLTTIYFPMSLFFVLRSDSTKKNKIMNLIIYAMIIAYIMISFFTNNLQPYIPGDNVFHEKEFWTGFSATESFLKSDGLILILLLPVVFGLIMTVGKGVKQADSIMILITGILMTPPLLAGFSTITNGDYRMIPLVVFFAIGLGTIFSSKNNAIVQSKKIGLGSYCVFALTTTILILVMTDVIFPHLVHRYYLAFL